MGGISSGRAATSALLLAWLSACAGPGGPAVSAADGAAWVSRGERDGRVTVTEASYDPGSAARSRGAAAAPAGSPGQPAALMQAVEALLGGMPAAAPASSPAPAPERRRAAPRPPAAAPQPAEQAAAGRPAPDAAARTTSPPAEMMPITAAPRPRVAAESLAPPPAPLQTGRSRIFSAPAEAQ